MTLTFDPLTLKVCGRSGASNIPNLDRTCTFIVVFKIRLVFRHVGPFQNDSASKATRVKKSRPNFAHLLPPVKIRGVVSELPE